MSNQITVVGTLAADPKDIRLSNGGGMCSFRLASNDRRFDREKNDWVDGPTNWFTVNVFRTLGEHALQSFRKGDRIILTGRLRVRNWETSEKSGIAVEIDAEALGHDLRWGTSQFTRSAWQQAKVATATDNAAADNKAADSFASPDTSSGTVNAGTAPHEPGADESSTEGSGAALPQYGFSHPDAGADGFANESRAAA